MEAGWEEVGGGGGFVEGGEEEACVGCAKVGLRVGNCEEVKVRYKVARAM